MPETPTSEGSIVAYLRVNDSDWNAKLDAAEQKARDLGRISPNIRVTADTADAIAKLDAARLAAERVGGNHVTTVTTVNESVSNATGSGRTSQAAAMDAVTAASKQLEAAQNALARAQAAQETASRAAANAASSQYLAEMRLADVQDKRGRTEYQLAAAEEAAARASRNAEAAENREIAATDRLTAAQAALAAAEEAARHAQDDNTNSTDNAAKANAGNLGYMGMIVAAVAALTPLMADLAGFVAGVGGAFAGMGAAGVLAVLGIKAAMTEGNALGQSYTQTVGDLKGNLDELEQTAASGLLQPFQQAVGEMSVGMPQLNQEIGQFANDLGNIGSTIMSTLVRGFAILNPLFQQGATYLQGLADAWQSWVNDGGLEKFAQDAEQALPLVGNTLSELITLVLNLISAMAPFGTVVLNTLNALVAVLNMIPAPVLVDLAAGAVAVAVAFKGWAPLTGMISGVVGALGKLPGVTALSEDATKALSTSLTSMVGWFGVAAAVIGAGTAAVDAWKTAVEDGAATEADLENAIRTGSDAAGGYGVALQRANAWLNEGTTSASDMKNALEAAANGWGGLQQAFNSWFGSLAPASAISGQVLNTLNDYGNSLGTVAKTDLPAAQQSFRAFSAEYDLNAQAQWRAINNMGTFKDALTAQASQMGVASTQANLLAIATGNYVDATKQGSGASNTLAGEQKLLSAAQKQVTTDTNNLANALNSLGLENRNADQANIAYQQSLDTASQAVKTNGATLDETTAKGRANATALDGIANAGLALIAAQAKQGASEQTLQGNMANTRQAFINAATAAGDTTDQANKLADQFGLIPSQVAIQFSTSGLGDAIAQVDQLQSAISLLLSAQHEVSVGGSAAGYYGFGHSAGGVVSRGHAAGGVVTGPGNAFSDTAGNYYPVSDGEWIVSNMAGQSTKWSPVLDMINRNMGPQKIADQAMRIAGPGPATAVPQSPVVHVTHNWYVTTNNGEQLVQDFMRKTAAQM